MIEEAFNPSEEWLSKERVISIFGNESLANPSKTIQLVEADIPSDKYLKLALQRYEEFKEKLTNSDRGNENDNYLRERFSKSYSVEHGYSVMGRILSYAVRAYLNYCREEASEPCITELAELLRSKQAFEELVLFLALLPNVINQIYEQAYELLQPSFKCDSNIIPYQVSKRGDGVLIIYPAENLEDSVLINSIPYTFNKSINNPSSICPASRVFLKKLWNNLINTCERDPDLFASDFSSI